jgi:hypothetical protein
VLGWDCRARADERGRAVICGYRSRSFDEEARADPRGPPIRITSVRRTWVAFMVVVGIAAVTSVREVVGPALATQPSTDAGTSAPRPRLLGIVTDGQRPAQLVILDPLTLRSSRSGLRVGWDTIPVAFSPNGRTLALTRAHYGQGAIRFVDTARLWVQGVIPQALGLNLAAAAWPEPRRLLVVSGDCCPALMRFSLMDPEARRVLKRRVIAQGETVVGHARTRHGLALLLAPRGVIGKARLVTFDENGRQRSTVLSGISAGASLAANRQRVPGLALDPVSGRAFVADADDSLAEINLATLAVSYHRLLQTRSGSRRRSQFEPAAKQKGFVGPVREAIWLGRGRLAVSGVDWQGANGDAARPAGLKLTDTSSWTVRTLDRDTAAAAVADGVLVGFGGGFREPFVDRTQGAGLVAYDLTGGRRFVLFPRQPNTFVAVAGRYAYVRPLGSARLTVVHLDTGRIASRIKRSGLPPLLLTRETKLP